MGCLKGKKTAPEKPGNYKCSKCGATAEKKCDLCKPEKIKEEKKPKKKGK